MIIITDTDTIVDASKVTKIFIGGQRDNTSIRCEFGVGVGCEIARYSKKNISQYVLGMIAQAWSSDERLFEIPKEPDVIAKMNLPKTAISHVKTKENRRGGS
jgi:hypothetical protein